MLLRGAKSDDKRIVFQKYRLIPHCLIFQLRKILHDPVKDLTQTLSMCFILNR